MKHLLIIEDELISANRLKNMILNLDDTLIIDGPLTNIQQVIETLSNNNTYDLIFSDIRLGQHTVFEAFHQVMPNSFVIFTTAYDEFAMEAIHSNGIEYLLKPFDIQDLQRAIQKVYLSPKNTPQLLRLGHDLKCYQERFLVGKGDELVSLQSEEISCFQRDPECVLAITANGEQYRMPVTLSELEEKINPQIFFRINRKYIANIKYIKKISFFFNSKLKVRITGCSDDQIIVSKERASLFKAWLNK